MRPTFSPTRFDRERSQIKHRVAAADHRHRSRYSTGCSPKSPIASCNASTENVVHNTGLSSIHFPMPTKLPSGRCRSFSSRINSTRQSCPFPETSVILGSSYAPSALPKGEGDKGEGDKGEGDKGEGDSHQLTREKGTVTN